ncbi:class I SAM-dependent methyltransferase [Patescibacteria group bacterium]
MLKKKPKIIKRESGSFRDPSGFLFYKNNIIYRQINKFCKKDFDLMESSGLYSELVDQNLLISHKQTDSVKPVTEDSYKIIKPQLIPFVSYPYEWSFSQLKDAALLTLKIQKIALAHKMSLKDASAYNVQFIGHRPVFIDTLSFEKLPKGKPWVAYKQFCQHFLAPLSLMALSDIRLGLLMREFIDGIPLDLASKLLPNKTRFNLGLYFHIHLHAKSQQRYADIVVKKQKAKGQLSDKSLLGFIDSLESTIKGLRWQPEGTEWAAYYEDDSYIPKAIKDKQKIVQRFISNVKPKTVWDIGANNGLFSRLASDKDIYTIASDIDPAAVEQGYIISQNRKEKYILPLVIDLTNPSPDLGWANNERKSFINRGPVDMVFALALIHHLAISNNLPLTKIAQFTHSISKYLVIEFVPKSDPKVKKLLATRKDIFPDYTVEGFKKAFLTLYKIEKSVKIKNSQRILYLMKSR